MEFPTALEVENASKETLARWYRFLVPTAEDEKRASEQRKIIARVKSRFESMGGMDAALFKKIGY